MNKTVLVGNWNKQKGKLKQYFAAATNNDLLFEKGVNDEALGKLQVRLGKSKVELLNLFPLFKPNSSLLELHDSIKF